MRICVSVSVLVYVSVVCVAAPVTRHTRRGEVNPTGHKPSSTPATEEDEDTSVQSGDIYSDARQLVIITKE